MWLLWYRKDLFDKAGVARAEAPDELAADAAKVTTAEQIMGFTMGASTGNLGAGA